MIMSLKVEFFFFRINLRLLSHTQKKLTMFEHIRITYIPCASDHTIYILSISLLITDISLFGESTNKKGYECSKRQKIILKIASSIYHTLTHMCSTARIR